MGKKKYKFFLSAKFCFLFYLFQVEWEKHVVSFLELFNQFDFFWWIMIKVLEFIKSVQHEWRLPHNLVFIFQVEMCCHLENRKKNFANFRLLGFCSPHSHQPESLRPSNRPPSPRDTRPRCLRPTPALPTPTHPRVLTPPARLPPA